MDTRQGLRHFLPAQPVDRDARRQDFVHAKRRGRANASGTTANLIHGIPEQIAAISSFATLLPGEVILTGTPNASGHLDPGDETVVTVEGMVSCVTWCCVREFGTASCGAYHPDPRRCRARFYAYEKAAPAINRIRVSRTGDRGTGL